MKIVLGIDPGLSGGIAVMDEAGPIYVQKMPVISSDGKKVIDPGAIRDVIRKFRPHEGFEMVAVIEKVHAMPGQGVTSMFSFGFGYGVLVGVLSAMQVPIEHVRPQAWQKEVLGGIDSKLGKKRAVVWALDRYPSLGKLPDGQADALAMAHYGRLRLTGAKS